MVIENLEAFSRGSHLEGIFDTGQIQQHTGIMCQLIKDEYNLNFFLLKSDVIRCITDFLLMEQSNFQSNNQTHSRLCNLVLCK